MTDADGSDWPPVGYVHKRHIHLPFNDQYDTDQPIVGARRTEVYNEEDDTQVISKLAGRYAREVERHHRAAERAEERLRLYERFGEDVYGDEEVLFFKKRFISTSTEYLYVALKANGQWYLSGPTNERSKSWIQLLAFIIEGNRLEDIEVYRASEWESVL